MESKNEFCASVKDGSRAPYISDFKWHEVEALDPSKEKAFELMLIKTKLMPLSCTQGINYIRGGYAEGGWGWAEFGCKY